MKVMSFVEYWIIMRNWEGGLRKGGNEKRRRGRIIER